MNPSEVQIVSDQGRRKQWGYGKLFYRQEGGKDRLNTKAVSWTTISIFGVVMVIGVLKDHSEVQSDHRSSIETPALSAADNKVIHIPVVVQSEPSVAKSTTKRSTTVATKAVDNLQFSALQKVERTGQLKIPPGSLVKAKLTSGASDGPVRAVLVENLTIDSEPSIKSGTTVIGTGTSTEERLMVSFNHLVFKDGTSIHIEAQACDGDDQMPGLTGSNVRGKALKIGGALGLGLLGGTALGLQNRQNQKTGELPSMRDALLNGVATASLEQARSVTSDIQNTRALYEIAKGREFYVLFSGDGN